MRCHYLSDLHLESQDFGWRLPRGDVLIVAGDLCHAACLDPARATIYAARQRERVLPLMEQACRSFAHVLLVAGNHDHYDGVLEDTATLFRRHLPGVTVLDDEAVDIDDVRFVGSTLWSDLGGADEAGRLRIRKGCGEYFFVKTRGGSGGGLEKLRPEHTLAAHMRARAAIERALTLPGAPKKVVITHFPPSLKGLNPLFAGNGLDGAYASDLDHWVEGIGAAVWVHGHTHIKRVYRIGPTEMRANCRGFDGRSGAVKGFSVNEFFEV